MKKHTASLMTAAMLLTVAWMTGCDSEKVEQTGTDISAVETTALTLSSADGASTESQTVSAAATAADSQESGQSNLEFDSYDAFLESLGEHYPGVAMIAPSQIVSGEWTVTKVYLLISGEQPLYEYAVTTPEGDSLLLTVSHEMQFASAEELKSQLEVSDSTQIQDGYIGSSWVVCKVENPEAYALYGLTGDESVYYALIGADAEGNTLEPEELQTYHDAMRL